MTEYKSSEFVNDSDDSSNEVSVEIPIKTVTNTASTHEKKKVDGKVVAKSAKLLEKRSSSSTTEATSKTSDKVKTEDSTDATIEKLKKLVVACGVRKQWSKELKGMDTKRAISHLRTLLTSLGMTGKMSLKQAKEIGAKRAFEKELEELQQSKPHFKSPPQRRKSLTSSKRSSVVKESTPPAIPSDVEDDVDGNETAEVSDKEESTEPQAKRVRKSLIVDDDEE